MECYGLFTGTLKTEFSYNMAYGRVCGKKSFAAYFKKLYSSKNTEMDITLLRSCRKEEYEMP